VAPVPGCRSCGSPGLEVFLELGETPLADALLTADQLDEPEATHPLDVAFCRRCSLVQILHEVPPEVLFVDNYHYFSSFSDTLLAHSRAHARWLADQRELGPESLVVEVASNDGYLLRNFVDWGIPVLGIEPSPGPAAAAQRAGIPTRREFFDADLARRLRDERGPADVIVANNVMAHTPHLNSFVEGIAVLLADDGVATVENAYVRDLVDRTEFDTIYHEHFCYFSCTAVDHLVRRHGLTLTRVERFPDLHGGTVRWHLARHGPPHPSVAEVLAEEEAAGVTAPAYYRGFSDRVHSVVDELRALLGRLQAEGARLAAYGAAAKGATLLNCAGVGTELLGFVADRNVHKQGRFMPGVRVPIVGAEALLRERPDYVLLLAWNFAAEIVAQQQDFLRAGGRFVVPIPWPRVLDDLPAALR
jgi:SAM-dependent methyltransferase